MRSLILLLCFTVLISCNSVSNAKLTLLNGYWEIDRVEFPNGGEKQYKMSQNIDYIQLKNLKGFRKKVNPKFDGSYETSDDAELFEIQINDGLYTIMYKNDLSEWQETLTAISKDNFSAQNADGIQYHYKRFEPINLTP